MTRSLFVILLGLAGVRPGSGQVPLPDTLVVFAAADLAGVLPDLGDRYRALTGVVVLPVLGSSGFLAFQIQQGAPADLFLSANMDFVERLSTRGTVNRRTMRRYARGELVVAWAEGSSGPVIHLEDLLRPDIRRVALANPDHAPYGMAAREALQRAGLWERLSPKLVLGENVRQALQYLQAGAVEAALVSRSLATTPGVGWAPVDSALYRSLDQGAAVVTGSPRSRQAAAFLDFLTGAEGLGILLRHGFHRPGP